MSAVYVDTGAFIALVRQRDADHDAVRRHYVALRQAGTLFVTAEAVVAESATRLRYDAGLGAALRFRDVVREAAAAGHLRVRESDPDLRDRAFAVMEQYADLPLSYADCVGAAVAREAGAAQVFGLDHHFGLLGFELAPG